MKTKYKVAIYLACCFFISRGFLKAQCTVNSPCGYGIDIFIKPLQVVPTSMTCPSGFNYDILFSYTIVVSGTNSCYNDVIGFQPLINCNGQNSGYYSINVSAPSVGASAVNSSQTGTLTTGTNQYSSGTNCATVTPASLNCNSLQVTIYGPGISSSTYPCSFSTLPITLLDFTARKVDRHVALSWITVSEKNNSLFQVQRSYDGLTWETIITRNGAGSSNEIHNYQAEDDSFSESLIYYRLKQIDFDGSSNYSEVRVLNMTEQPSSVRYFPNPFDNSVSLETDNDLTKAIFVTNCLGQTVRSGQMEKRLLLDLSTEASGIYFIKIKSATSEENFKLLKN